MAACGIRALRLMYLFTCTKSHQSCACYRAATIDNRTYKESKVEHCLISARRIIWRDSLSVSVATPYKLWAGMGKWLLKIQPCIYWKVNISQINVSFIQLGDDNTGLRMGCLTLSKCIPSLSLIMLSFPVVRREGCQGKVHLCAVCPESSGALKGVLGENLCRLWKGCLSSLLFTLTLQNANQKADMNMIMWLFSHLACKEVYYIIIFVCTACLFIFSIGNKLGKCIMVSYPELSVWDWFRATV